MVQSWPPLHHRDDDGSPVGVLDVCEEEDHVYLSRIEILPEAQGRRIGTAVIQDLLAEAGPVRLHVFADNVRARRLYERMGFVIDGRDDGGRYSMPHSAG